MVLIPLLYQLFTYKLFSFLRCLLDHNGALSTYLISSDFTSSLSEHLSKMGFLYGLLGLLHILLLVTELFQNQLD